MSLIAWRKLQAGLSGKGDLKDILGAVQHIQVNATAPDLDFANLTTNNLVVKRTNKLPVGTDKYKLPLVAEQDFTNFTEVDPNTRIDVTASRVTFTNLTIDEDAYVYADKGAGYFNGDFTHHLTVEITAMSAGSNADHVCVWALTNHLDDWQGLADANRSFLTVMLILSTTTPRIELTEFNAGSEAGPADQYVAALNTKYYLTVSRDEATGANGTLTLKIYSDAGRTNLLDTQTQTLSQSKTDYRYLFAALSRNFTAGFTVSGYTENANLIDVDQAGYTWAEDSNLRSFDENGIERTYIHTGDVDDTPVDGATTDPVSSNWAFDHVGSADPHTVYMLESNIGSGSGNYPIMDTAAVDNDYAKFTGTGFEGIAYPDVLVDLSGQGTANFDWNNVALINTGTITAGTSVWHHEHDLFATSLNPGASGATRTAPNSNTIGGWQLNAAGETLYFEAHMEVEWDASSDLIVNAWWEVNVDNTGGTATDTVDLRLVVRYKGEGDTAIKTQTVEVATTVGASAQYKQFQTAFTIDYDAASNVIDSLDLLSFTINLETDTSEVDDIILNLMELRYATTKPSLEA